MSTITPHKLGVHKILSHIPLNVIFDAPAKARLRKAVNIADLRLCAKQRAHKVSRLWTGFTFGLVALLTHSDWEANAVCRRLIHVACAVRLPGCKPAVSSALKVRTSFN